MALCKISQDVDRKYREALGEHRDTVQNGCKTLWVSAIRGSRYVWPGKLKRPPLPSGVKRRMWNIRRKCRMWDIRVECRHSRIPDVRHPGGMAAQQNSGCDTSGWNGGALPYPDHHTRTIAYPIRICCPDTMHIISGYVVWMKTLTKVSKHNPRYTSMVCPDALSGHLLQGRSHTPCIPDFLMEKDFKASVSSCFWALSGCPRFQRTLLNLGLLWW